MRDQDEVVQTLVKFAEEHSDIAALWLYGYRGGASYHVESRN